MVMFPPLPHESCDVGVAPPQPEDSAHRLTKADIIASQEEATEERQKSLVSTETIAAQVIKLDIARIRPSPDGKSPFVAVAQLVTGTAKYVSVDMTRYTAYAPRSVFHPNQFQRKGPPPPEAKGPAKGAATPRRATTGSSSETARTSARDMSRANKERLPITAIRFDARTLNLHLSLRVQEVLGCAEAMWDVVEAYQERACLERPQSSRAPSMTSSHMSSDGSSSTSSRPAHHATRNPKWKDLLALRRFEFDALLRRFKLSVVPGLHLRP